MDAEDYDRDDIHELVADLAEALEQPEPDGTTVIWQDDGPYVGIRADHLRSIIVRARRRTVPDTPRSAERRPPSCRPTWDRR